MDVIITYVDITDKFIKSYKTYCKKELNENRFRSYGVLDLQVKGIRKYMPYVNNIFIVVSDKEQVEGIDLNGCTIITHDMIIPQKYLPCFNSCTIEMFLHKIPDLSEEFIYFNDDIFVINDIPEKYWFIKHKPNLWVDPKDFDKEDTNIYHRNLYNSTRLISEELKYHSYKNKYLRFSHSARPFLKSSCERVFNKHILYILNSLTRTRHSKNLNMTVFNCYDYFSLNYNKVDKNYSYFDNYNINDIVNTIYKKEKPIICVNDSDYYNFDIFKDNLRKSLEANILGKKYILTKKQIKEKIKEKNLNNTPIKVALCAIAKNENLYIREWVEWYKNLGISKIFLYDNNELDGERFEDVINDYIENGFVELQNWRGIIKSVKSDKDGQTTQGLAYNNCFYNHFKEFDWMCFFDIDEYLEIYNTYNNLYEFLNDFNEYHGIRVQWKMYGDNEQLYYENKPLFERFKVESNASYDKHVKQILNCNKEFDEELLFCAHGVFNKKYNFVNVIKRKPRNVYMDYEPYNNLCVYLNHFYSKSTEEFLKRKYNKTSAVTGINNTRNFNIEFLKKQYFEHNNQTLEKENMFNSYDEFKEAKNYDHIIISFTSYKERLSSCHLMINSLLNNTIKPYKICLTLYIDDIMYLSHELREMIKNNILELIIADKNLRPHLKYFYTMQKYRDYPIITVDDDCLFKEDFIESLINSYKKYPNCISARRVHKKTYDGSKIMNYEKWIKAYNKILLPSVDIVATGVGGVLYPPDILHITNDNLEDIYKYITVDDIYLHYLELKNNIPIVYVPNKKSHPEIINGTQETALCININKANEEDDNSPNNIAIRNLIEHI